MRMIGPDDWPEWRDLRLLALAADPGAFASSLGREQEYDEQRWRELCTPPAVLAFDDATPVAMGAGFADQPGSLLVVAMWTRPEWRGQGIGGEVLDTLTAWAVAHDRRPRLWVMLTNREVERLYARHGYVRTGRVEDYEGREAVELALRAQARP